MAEGKQSASCAVLTCMSIFSFKCVRTLAVAWLSTGGNLGGREMGGGRDTEGEGGEV